MDAVFLNRAGNVDQVFVDHGYECDVTPGGEVAEDLVEGVNVILAVVWWQGNTGEQDFDVRVFQSSQNLIEVAASLIRGEAAQAVVATEFDDDDFRMQQKDVVHAGDGIFCGGATGTLVVHLVAVAAAIEIALQCVGVGLPSLKTVTGGDAIAETN